MTQSGPDTDRTVRPFVQESDRQGWIGGPFERAIRRATSHRHAKSAGNLVALTTIQVANALLPLVAFPLILSAVGDKGYSKVVVTESIALMVQTLVIYSFDVEGVSTLARLNVERDRTEVSLLFSSILFARLAILGLATLAIVALSPIYDRAFFPLLLAWMMFPLAYALQSAWFFQAIERNAAAAVVVLLSRITCVVLMRLVVTSPGDFIYAPMIIGGCYAASGAILLGYIVLKHGVRIVPVPITRMRSLFGDGRHIFAGNLSVTLYRDSNVLILNAFSTSSAVATYSIAEKLIKVAQAVARPLNQLFFPKVIRALATDSEPSPSTFKTVLRYTYPQLGLVALAAITAATAYGVLHPFLPPSFRSAEAHRIVSLAGIMSISILFGVANFMFGTGGLNFLGHRRYFAGAILVTGVCSIAICLTLTSLFGAVGAAISFVSAEILLFLIVSRAYRK